LGPFGPKVALMADPIPCPSCGEVLAEAVTERGILPADGGPEIPFRRTTDYVMCSSCFMVYGIRELQATVPPPEDDDDVIAHLERMAERRRRPAS